MLISHENRRSHNHQHPSSSSQTLQLPFTSTSTASLPSPPLHPTSRTFFNNLPHTSANPSPSDLNGKQLQHYFDSAARGSPTEFIDTSNLPISSIDQYMANNLDFQSNPSSMLTGFQGLGDGSDSFNIPMWNSVHGANGMTNGVANPMQTLSRSQAGPSHHSRAPSTASLASQSTGSPGQAHRGQGLRVTDHSSRKQPSNLSASQGFARKQSSGGSHLPTPTQTPTQDSFLASANTAAYQQQPQSGSSNNNNINHTVAASQAMNSALLDQSQDEDHPGMSHSGRPSFSSVQGPSTPLTTMADMNDQGIKATHNGETILPYSADVEAWLDEYLQFGDDSDTMPRPMVPKLERTVTDAYNDELYFPSAMPATTVATNPSYLVPQANSMITDRLHAAQMARSNSSHSSQSRGLSPFQADSPWTHNSSMRSGSQLRQRLDRPDASDIGYQTSPQTDSEPKTISPKEAMLDYKPEQNEIPLFPQSSASYATQQPVMALAPSQQQYVPTSSMAFGNMVSTTGAGWNASLQSMSAPYQNYSNLMAPHLPMNTFSMGPSYGIVQNGRSSDRTPEFPAHLTSMDSSASEAAPASSMASSAMMQDSPKPVDSSAHTGTYSCTYHGCTERFSTPQKLQKHKRDAHRKTSNVTPGVGSGMTAAQLMERNSQSGPHKCERTNPTTGKPCNTIFSRPYDLTRHEDTIHNIRKQKVRCALCQEEKTFSRADALTRHMRVVHPEVDFPGKHSRRRGGSSP